MMARIILLTLLLSSCEGKIQFAQQHEFDKNSTNNNAPGQTISESNNKTSGTEECRTRPKNRNDEIRLALEPFCKDCHGKVNSTPFFASLEAFEAGLVYNPKFVKPGNSKDSKLIHFLRGKAEGAFPQMPLGNEDNKYVSLVDQGVATLRVEEIETWIDTLAPDVSFRGKASGRSITISRLSADQILSAIQIALGQAPTGGRKKDGLAMLGSTPLSPAIFTPITSLQRDLYLGLGGSDYLERGRGDKVWTTTGVGILNQVAQGACALAVSRNNATLFKYASLTDKLPDQENEIKMNIAYLYQRFLYESATEDDIDALFEEIYRPAELISTKIAWTQICTALIRDPLFITL